jgi:hypothetical protein
MQTCIGKLAGSAIHLRAGSPGRAQSSISFKTAG